MKKKLLISLLTLPLLMTACGGGQGGQGGESGSGTQSQQEHTQDEVTKYMDELKESSEKDHFYLHYYRYAQTAADYNNWDVWAWPFSPKAGEGARFDWVGRTQAADHMSASGNATIDKFGYATLDIDLTKEYDGGWDNVNKKIGGEKTDFYNKDKSALDEKIGVQIVESQTRITGSGFWSNDGSNLFVTLDKYALEGKAGTSYHVFVTQDLVQSPTAVPPTEHTDPFDNDDGSNVTYGKASDVNFKQTSPIQATSPLFLKGDKNVNYLTNGAGVGYQIMVGSFADSDKDGLGDIYGITKKLDYLKNLGVNVLWLTPIQLSDSYHGYDISDYTQVDPKFGSTVSPNTKNGVPTSDSAMKDYKDLIAGAHERGMAVVMDLVLNHTATTNKWFINSAQLDEDYRTFYQWGNHDVKDEKHPYGQSEQINQEKFWYPYGDHCYSYYAKFGSSMPEINYSYVSTRAAVATMANQWCEIGVDGFRMDAVKHIFLEEEVKTDSGDKIIKDISTNSAGYEQDYSSNLTKNLHFWRQLAADVKKNHPNCFFVGENFDGHAYQVAPYYEGFDSLFDFYSYFNITTLAAKSYGVNASKIYGGPTSAYGWLNQGGTSTYDGKQVKWDLMNIMATNNSYRGATTLNADTGYTAINGMFTSNHDIARTINRIAGVGKQGDEGLSAQGNVTSGSFSKLDKLATLAQITELMLPGCTWIYYGDEIGMTGNFPNTTYNIKMKNGTVKTVQYDKDAPYADLWYRQPMKWVKNAQPGDDSMTTGYSVTGSGMTVGWDSINGSATMKSVAEQITNTSSHYAAIKAFATAKSKTPALIRGIVTPHGWDGSGGSYIFNFDRQLGNETYRVMVNMSDKNQDLGGGFSSYTQVAAYNGASKTSLPAYSAVLLKK